MDILAGMLAYLAGIGAVLGGLAVAFLLFASPHTATPNPAAETPNATAMLVRPHAPSKTGAPQMTSKQTAAQENHNPKTATKTATKTTTAPADLKRTTTAAKGTPRREEDRAPRWAYQQVSNFGERFLGYAE